MLKSQKPYAAIVEREFRRASGVKEVTLVDFDNDDERIIIIADGDPWVMNIGSDDDEFVFENIRTQMMKTFAFPPDWIELEENQK